MPSIIDGLFSGRAGIQSHGIGISVLADNISNSNTIGFKSSRADFRDLVAGNISGGSGSNVTVGSGSSVGNVTQIFNQGSFEFTGRSLDLAIDGNGFFIVEDSTGERLYSRAGNFKVDSDGNLLNQNGFSVLGFPANGSGGLEALNVNEISRDSVATGEVTIGGNLNAAATVAAVPDPATDPTFSELASGATFSTFVDVFDSLGGSHTVNTYFYYQGGSDWVVQAYVDGGDVTGGTAGEPFLISGPVADPDAVTISFENDGTRSVPLPASDFTATPAWVSGAASDGIDFLFNPLTQYASPSSISNITQDGSGSGSVVSVSFDEDGTLFASLDNGQTANIGTIALTSFANPEGLRRRSGSLYAESSTSGEPVAGTPGAGDFGKIQAEAIELSTSDLASDFVKLISYQRGFQGSSRMITSIDDLFNELVNLA